MSKWFKRVMSVLLVCALFGGAAPVGTITASAAFTATPMVAAGNAHSVALKSDGTVWSWGDNSVNQLGDGTDISRTTPVQVQNLSNIIAISAGGIHSLALKNDGTVWAWGWNRSGQLGDNTTTDRSIPVQVQNLNNIIAISAGEGHSLALKNDGTVWGWGSNYAWQLSNVLSNVVVSYTTPVLIPGQIRDLKNINAISAGSDFSLALRNDGTVWAWGHSTYGELGNGTFTYSPAPVQTHNLSGISAISAGSRHSIAIKNDGTVWTWGYDGSTYSINTWKSTPVRLQIGDVSAISAGGDVSLALKNNGTVWLGSGANEISTQIQNLIDIIDISRGSNYSVAVKDDGTVWAWGNNAGGQLGNGTTINSSNPVQVWGPGGVGRLNLFDSQQVRPTTVALSKSSYYGNIGDEILVSGTFSSLTIAAGSSTVIWSCSDPAAVTFGQMSVLGPNDDAIISTPLTLNKPGTYTITVSTTDGVNAQATLNILGSETIFSLNDASGELNGNITIEGIIIPYPVIAVDFGDPNSDAKFEAMRNIVHSITWSCSDVDAITFGDVNCGGFGPAFAITMPISLRKKGTFTVTATIPGRPSVTINITINDSFPAKPTLTFNGKNTSDKFTAVWDETLFSSDPNLKTYSDTQSWKNLAFISSMLSGLAYNKNDLSRELTKIGFNEPAYFNETSGVFLPGYAFAHKKIMRNGQQRDLVVAVFRGTHWEKIGDWNNGWTDFGLDGTQVLGGINFAAGVAHVVLANYMSSHGIDPQTAVYLITGHSLGGGMANCVANRLSDLYSNSNIFGFTYASPKTTMQNLFPQQNISNFISASDTIAYIGLLGVGGRWFGKNY